ncbi:hepcidin [Sorex fumeus]|uniref:hepcidin n=1 Tax=Sorex fumeus TaxID=62283 RepID=UPI0024AE4135|nr:hepcidin [Sorex fumeus]
MVRNAQAQAICLLLLLLTSLASTSTLRQQASQHTELQRPSTVAATSQTDKKPVERRLWKRDAHFPICMFCCNCCGKTCGFCCRS